MSFAVYELLAPPSVSAGETSGSYRTALDEQTTAVARAIERAIQRHSDVIDWQSNLEVQREMRRDIKRELRGTGDFTEERLDELAHQIVDVARQRSRIVSERGDPSVSARSTIEFEVRRSPRRRKTVQITVDGGRRSGHRACFDARRRVAGDRAQARGLDHAPQHRGDAGRRA